MKIDISNPTIKKGLVSILFYVAAGAVIFFLNEWSPSGPCTPGLGILAFLILPVVSAIRLAANAVKVYQGNKASQASMAVHFFFLSGFIIFLRRSVN
jgi:hypothetical protein